MNFTERVRQQFLEVMKGAGGAERAFRQNAWDAFEIQGLPAKSNEYWKYSAHSALTGPVWGEAARVGTLPSMAGEIRARYAADFDIVFVLNGVPQPSTAKEFSLQARTFDSVGAPLNFDDGFLSAAAAVNNGGFDLTVADGVRVARPVLLVHILSGEGSWSSSLNRIVLGKGAELRLAELFVSEAVSYLRTDITRAELSEGAVLQWVRAQQEKATGSYFSEAQLHLQARSTASLTQLNCGAAWSRSSIKVDIRGEGAEAAVNGLSFGQLEQHVDQRVQVSHHAGHSTSSQLFKGVLKDQARGILNGKIYIARGAQRVISSQLNHNLLLSPGAEANTKPELEVYADDVKANHGASVGRLDEGKLFYLMSRGISRSASERMLAQAFTADVVMKISSPQLRQFAFANVGDLILGGEQ